MGKAERTRARRAREKIAAQRRAARRAQTRLRVLIAGGSVAVVLAPSSPVGKDIDGAANVITAALCRLTRGQPGNACASAGVTAAAGSI